MSSVPGAAALPSARPRGPARSPHRGPRPLARLWTALGLVAVLALGGYFAWETLFYVPPEKDASTGLPGEFIASQGNLHLANGARFLAYSSDPPTSGPHWIGAGAYYRTAGGLATTIPPQWGVYSEELPNEMLVHSMEHGGVIVWYNPRAGCDGRCVALLSASVTRYVARGQHVIMVPYAGLRTPVALTSWTRLERLDHPDAARLAAFVVAHDRRYDPEGL